MSAETTAARSSACAVCAVCSRDIPDKVRSLLGIDVDVGLNSEGGREYLRIVVNGLGGEGGVCRRGQALGAGVGRHEGCFREERGQGLGPFVVN